MGKLLFGTGGVPRSTKSASSIAGVERIRQLDLDCLELEFVHGVRMGEATAQALAEAAKINRVVLSAHAPYYVNLNALEETKAQASIQRIIDTARILQICGGRNVVFHAGYYLGMEQGDVYAKIKQRMTRIIERLRGEGLDQIILAPETTGKATQFGSTAELIALSKELSQVRLCIDFAHLYARTKGEINSYAAFARIITDCQAKLGASVLQDMHIHVAGIEYTASGEKKHRDIEDSGFNYRELLQVLKDYGVYGTVICESPRLEDDALLMKEFYAGL